MVTLPLNICWLPQSELGDLPGGVDSRESACSVGDPVSIPGSGRSPGEGNGNSVQYPCLENSVDEGTWQAWGRKESDTIKRVHFTSWNEQSKGRLEICYETH